MRRIPSIASALAAAAVALLASAALAGGPTPSRDGTWAFKGTLSDACQCNVFCACEFGHKPSFGHCDDTAILSIDQGHYGDVRLDGLRVVVASKSPEGERLVDTVGHLDFAHFYVPEDATDAQMQALADLARRVFGTFVEGDVARISAVETVERVPMTVSIEPTHHVAKIPGVLDLDIQALTGWDGENPVVLKNGPSAGPGVGDILVAHSNTYSYKDHGIDWSYSGRSASMRTMDMNGSIAAPASDATPPEKAKSKSDSPIDSPIHEHNR